MESALFQLDALGATGPYRAFAKATICDVAGRPVAELSKVPKLFVQRSLAALHKATTLDPDARFAALARAAELYRGSIGGRPLDVHEHVVARVSGVPLATVRESTGVIATHAARAREIVARACPHGAVPAWERNAYDLTKTALWTRRGDVFAVLAAGNHPALHSLWLEALALGYRVAIRPSQNEPFTPHRLVLALREAGFGNDHVVLLPTDHDVAESIVDGADLATVYGGDEVVKKYHSRPTVQTHGPGRVKILVTAEVDLMQHLDTIVESISAGAGVSCRNATAVLVEGDTATVARAVSERLARLPILPPEHEHAVLPVAPATTARNLEQYVRSCAADAKLWAGQDGIAAELADGSAVLRPAIIELPSADLSRTGIEMPFPCAWIAPWSRTDGLSAFRNSLVVAAMTTDETLVRQLLEEPTIRNINVGDRPTHVMDPCLPADGYLGDFLMCNKSYERGDRKR